MDTKRTVLVVSAAVGVIALVIFLVRRAKGPDLSTRAGQAEAFAIKLDKKAKDADAAEAAGQKDVAQKLRAEVTVGKTAAKIKAMKFFGLGMHRGQDNTSMYRGGGYAGGGLLGMRG